MGTTLSTNGGLNDSQKAFCTKTGKDPIEYLMELRKLPNNRPATGTSKEKKVTKLKESLSKSDKPPKPRKFTWKRATAK